MTIPWLGTPEGPTVIKLRMIAYQVETRADLTASWSVEALDAIPGVSASDVARGLCRDYAAEHSGRWVQVSAWDLTLLLGGVVRLPDLPSTRLAWLRSLDDEHVRPDSQVVRPPTS
ncbi:hypothetical protein [Streptosporangium sp. NPDC048865]|uniref:hypothetical protein n=1 Tax=Streptosporangium sp. NPDC048865 TaxID=3155766 RepID=UPI003432AEB6